MKKIKIDVVGIAFAMLYTMIIIEMLLALSGCNFTRKLDKTENKKDSVVVSTIDSAWLKKLIETNTDSKASGSELRLYDPNLANKTSPTTLNNYYPASNDNSGLLAILTNWQHENQTQQKETIDSGSMAAKDSLHALQETATKETETKAGTPWYIYAFAAALAWLLIKDFITFKIARK